MKILRLALVLIWAARCGLAQAQVWQFDVDAADADPSETQAGYARVTVPAMTGNSTNGTFSPTATLQGVTVTATASGGFRDRDVGGALANQLLAALLRDFIFRDGAGGTIDITLNGLPAGCYDVRSFHFDNSNQGALTNNMFDLVVQHAQGTETYPGLVWSLEGNNYRVCSDGATPILITVRESGIGNRVRFNGLRIVRHYAFDVDAFDAPAAETQPGAVRLTAPAMLGDSINGAFTLSAAAGNLTLSAAATGGFRDRGTSGTLAGDPLAQWLRDFVFSDGSNATISVILSGLGAGSYEICSAHWDNVGTAAANAFDLVVQDVDGSRTITGQVWSVTGTRYAVNADGSAPVLITVREASANHRARFNGLEIGGGQTLASVPVPPAAPGDQVAGNLVLLNDNGGWCWYQDEKVIYDAAGGNLVASTIANQSGYGGASRGADVDALTFHLATGRRMRAGMGKRGSSGDDHNMGALWVRPDGTYFHVCTGHNDATRNSFYRISTQPHDGAAWGPEQFFNWPAIGNPDTSGNVTYHNLHYLPAEGPGPGRLYNISRESQRSPNLAFSDDQGQTWTYGGKLTLTRTASSYSNGYLKFADNRSNRIDFITTEHHPRDYNTSIYHGYIQEGKSWNSFGTVVDTNVFDELAPAPEDFTPVFLASAEDGVNDDREYHRAWTTDLERDLQGNLCALFTTRYGTNVASNRSGDADHRLFYARFDGVQWRTTELAKMGPPLYPSEQDYTGLGAIHPNNPDLVYISTPINPRDQAALGKREIFRGLTPDRGATWQWTQITRHSTVDNLRPAIPSWSAENTIVCWLRGDYFTMANFDESLVALIERHGEVTGLVSYQDATPANTVLADGSPFTFTGPSTNNGAADNQWHQRAGIGNGGSVFAAGEVAAEDAPALKTSLPGLPDGTYDVFVFFWSRPGEDWRLSAGISLSDMLVFRRYASQQAETNQFTAPVNVLDQDAALYRGYLGRKIVTAGSAIEVYVDDFNGLATAGTQRTAFDGLGVARVLNRVRIESVARNGNDLRLMVLGWAGFAYQLQRVATIPARPDDWQDINLPANGAGSSGLRRPVAPGASRRVRQPGWFLPH